MIFSNPLGYCATCNTGFNPPVNGLCPICSTYGGLRRPRVDGTKETGKKKKRRGPSKKAGAPSCVSAASRLRVFREDNWTCVKCGNLGGDLTVDHILPVSKGGTNARENLQTMCSACNNAKGDRIV